MNKEEHVRYRSDFQSMKSLSKALKKMQKSLGLEETGKLDTSTLDVMKKPRCGVPDVANYKTFDGDLKWDHNDVTYRSVGKKRLDSIRLKCTEFEMKGEQ